MNHIYNRNNIVVNISLFLLFLLFGGCTGKKPATIIVEEEQKSNIINLDDAFEVIKEIRLSDIADSVSFLPLETKSNCLVRSFAFSFTTSSIYNAPVGYFDWTGKYWGKIIRVGQGPYEEAGDGAYGRVLFKDNHYYSKASKLIEYDSKGSPTGKVMNLYAEREFSDNDKFRNGVEFFVAGKNLAIFGYPDKMYFINPDNFETISTRIISMSDTVLPPIWIQPVGGNFITFYKDKTVFYNFMNDTIFYVTDDGLEPQWIVNFTDKRLPSEFVFRFGDLLADIGRIFRSGNSLDNSELVRLSDNKHYVAGAFETEQYVFFRMNEMIQFHERRGKEPPVPYIALFDKNTGETVRVKGSGFVDDLMGMDHFYPDKIFDEKMISYIWPHELLDFIEESQKNGHTVNPKMLALSKTIDADDNPIIIFVHLK